MTTCRRHMRRKVARFDAYSISPYAQLPQYRAHRRSPARLPRYRTKQSHAGNFTTSHHPLTHFAARAMRAVDYAIEDFYFSNAMLAVFCSHSYDSRFSLARHYLILLRLMAHTRFRYYRGHKGITS